MKTPSAGMPKALQSIILVLTLIILGLASAPASSAATPAATPSVAPAVTPPATPDSSGLHDVCSASQPQQMKCTAILNRNVGPRAQAEAFSATSLPAGYGPADLRSAYNVPTLPLATPRTVAVVVAFDAPTLEADLGVYRAKFGLPACTTANGCFKKVNQNGAASPLPPVNAGWAQEASLDVDMVSAACPGCRILVVEANSDRLSDLGPSVDTAVRLGAIAVSNSYGATEQAGFNNFDQYFTHPGVAVTVAAGDSGYITEYPASVPAVTAVGGTSLTYTNTGKGTGVNKAWSESAWGAVGSNTGTGSGCSAYAAKPAWQIDTGCANRAVADVSAVADPQTGVAVYDSTPDSGGYKGWLVMGGTSAAAPYIAGLAALAGAPTAGTTPASYAYAVPSALNDVKSGATGVCAPAYLCSGAGGYDGPTGLGTPNGLGALTDLDSVFTTMRDSLVRASIGTLVGQVTCAADGGCSQMYSSGAGYWSPTTGAHAVRSFIRTKWNALGGTSSRAGYPLGEQVDGLVNGGSSQKFQGGTMYWVPPTSGAYLSTPGAISDFWTAKGREQGALGYPTSDETAGPNGGTYQKFQNGIVYSSGTAGAHSVDGGILDMWTSAGGQNGKLGYPLGEQVDGLVNGGSSQKFQGGTIYSSAASGAHITTGGIQAVWERLGAERGKLGYPTAEEVGGLVNGGSSQKFQGGTIYSSAASGAHITTGGIQAVWERLGAERGKLGYPTSEEIGGLVNGGVYQTFQGGTIHWSPKSGAHLTTGAIRSAWSRFGYERGKMGYPTSDEIGGLRNGGVYQTYQGGIIYYSPATGGHMTTGGIRSAWSRFGFEKGKMGYPTSDEVSGLRNGGVYQKYQGGAFYYSPTTGAHSSTGAIRSAWGKLGYEKGRLGYPTSDEFSVSGGVRQNYQGGYIDYTSRYGTKVHLR